MQKLKNIEFLRTFLILLIVIHHMFIDRNWTLCTLFPQIDLYTEIKHFVNHAFNGVEAFFIISGFFLGVSKSNKDLKSFIKKKYIRLSPVIIFSMILCLIGTIIGVIHFKIIPNIMTILLLNNFGVCIAIGQNPVLWYTSALFSGLILYFLILKHFQKPVPIVSSLAITGYLILNIIHQGHFNHPLENYYYILNIGFLRALGGIGVGVLIAFWWKHYRENFPKYLPQKSFFYNIAEFIFLILFIWWLTFPHQKFNNTIFVIIFVCLFVLFLLKKGFISKFFDGDIWVKLGRYQYSLYVVHYVVIKIMGFALWQKNPIFVISHPIYPIFLMFFVIILLSVFAYHFVEVKIPEMLKNV